MNNSEIASNKTMLRLTFSRKDGEQLCFVHASAARFIGSSEAIFSNFHVPFSVHLLLSFLDVSLYAQQDKKVFVIPCYKLAVFQKQLRMLKTGKMVQRRRHYSEDFKLKIVKEYESGKSSVGELEKIYDISNAVIYRWIYKYSTYNKKSVQVVEMKNSQAEKIKRMEAHIKERSGL